jgi:outer membrane protein OmpA-like peptidoglycan-associated protein
MALSKENSSGSSQLQGLLDLLVDLEIVNQTKKSSEESPASNEEVKHEGEASESQLAEKCQDSYTNATRIPEPEPNRLIQPHLNEEQPEETTSRSIVSAENVAADNSLTAVEGLQNFLSEPQQQEEKTNQPLLSEVDLNQTQKSETPPEQVFNQLIQSHWQKAQQKEFTSQSISSTDDKTIEDSITLFERWQRLLLTQEVMDSREMIAKFKEKLENLEHQIYEPAELINLLLPLITEILSRKVAEAREEVAQAIAPIIDEIIQAKTQQDKVAISSALAPVLPDAVAQQVSNSPGDFAKALGPEMGTAIKEQISLDREAMVDALYPVIGSTISKYMAEAIKAINEKVENTLTPEGISRKIRAKMQGVSEAELIFKEAMPFTVQAIFLIHKASGLVISEVQPSDRQRLESEMVAGMLTAIRSFVNDCIAQSGEVSEIDQIEYGNSQIILEVAGYCYLAVVTQGQPPKSFIKKMRGDLASIVQNHGKAIELFDGDPANVPEQIHKILQDLTTASKTSTEKQKGKPPTALLLISLAVLLSTSLSLGIYQYRTWMNRRHEAETSLALASDPELAVYRLVVEANQGTLKLSGKLPNQYLRLKAEQIAKTVEPKLKINNAIIPVVVPADPVLAQAEVKRVTNLLNQMDGAVILADYREGKVTVRGTVLQEADARKVTEAFQQIPGVKSVTNTVQLQPLAIASRIYFDKGSSVLKSTELSKISQIKAFLEQYPNKHLKLLGHTDPKGTTTENQRMALERATKVRDALVTQGVDSKRLLVAGTLDPPLGVKAEQLPLLSRCVEFEMIEP